MGLDNGFILRSKTKKNSEYHLFTFRNFYALADFFRREPMLPNLESPDEQSYEYAVNKDILKRLQGQLEPIFTELHKLPANTVAYYDEYGYPAKYAKLFYSNDFDPVDSQSAFAGQKLIRLYQRIDALLEILDFMPDDAEIIFYDSY